MANWKCPKCGNEEFEKTNFKQQVEILLKYLMYKTKNLLQYHVLNADIQSYYRQDTSTGMNVLDFLMN